MSADDFFSLPRKISSHLTSENLVLLCVHGLGGSPKDFSPIITRCSGLSEVSFQFLELQGHGADRIPLSKQTQWIQSRINALTGKYGERYAVRMGKWFGHQKEQKVRTQLQDIRTVASLLATECFHASWSAWKEQVKSEIETLLRNGNTIIVVGYSLGSALVSSAVYEVLAAHPEYVPNVPALVLLNLPWLAARASHLLNWFIIGKWIEHHFAVLSSIFRGTQGVFQQWSKGFEAREWPLTFLASGENDPISSKYAPVVMPESVTVYHVSGKGHSLYDWPDEVFAMIDSFIVSQGKPQLRLAS